MYELVLCGCGSSGAGPGKQTRLFMQCCAKDEGCSCKSNCRDPQSTDSVAKMFVGSTVVWVIETRST